MVFCIGERGKNNNMYIRAIYTHLIRILDERKLDENGCWNNIWLSDRNKYESIIAISEYRLLLIFHCSASRSRVLLCVSLLSSRFYTLLRSRSASNGQLDFSLEHPINDRWRSGYVCISAMPEETKKKIKKC